MSIGRCKMRKYVLVVVLVVIAVLVTTCTPMVTAQAENLPPAWYPVQLPVGADAVDVWVTAGYLVTVQYDYLVVRYTYSPYAFARLYSLDNRYIVYLYLPIRRK